MLLKEHKSKIKERDILLDPARNALGIIPRFHFAGTAQLRNCAESLTGEPMYYTNLELVSYCKKQIKVLGYVPVTVRNGESVSKLNLYITTEYKEPLLGREWILQLQKKNSEIRNFMNTLQNIHKIQEADNLQLQQLLQEFKDITDLAISKIANVQAKLKLKDKVNPVFCKPRAVPFRLREKIEEELDKLTHSGILEKVDHLDWATPIVPVIKKNGTIRICGVYSVT